MTPTLQHGATTNNFDDHWLAETLRLRESQWGPLEDAAEAGKARARGGPFETRWLERACLLGQREGLTETLSQWRAIAKLTFLIFCVAAFLLGCGTAAAALGSGGPVNLAPTLTALLGVNTLALLLWLASFAMQPGAAGSVLARAWLHLTRKLARGPNASLMPRALMELLARQRLQRWGAGLLSHCFWTLALSGALFTLLGLLAIRRYTFHWETTLLSPDAFVLVIQALGSLPAALGFPEPSAQVIRSSGGQQSLPESAHAAWSVWLLGVVFVYGLLPRIAALVLSFLVVRKRLHSLEVDATLPGVAELRARLMPASENTGVDSPAPGPRTEKIQHAPTVQAGRSLYGIVGLELPEELNWQTSALPAGLDNLGVIDTREQRRQLLDMLRRQPAHRLLVCCDARQTPDRGSIAMLTDLAGVSAEMCIALLPDSSPQARREQWQQQLKRAGFAPENILSGLSPALQWLAAGIPAGSVQGLPE